MAQTFFTIDCKTNLHVGSGKANYGVIDQLIQRDATFQHPTIHASSLKGGIKEYCHHQKFPSMKHVFGSDKNDKVNTQIGGCKFFDAMLLCIPVRCDKRAYIHITCPDIINYLYESLPESNSLKTGLFDLKSIFGKEDSTNAYCFSSDMDGATIEDFDIKAGFDEVKSKMLSKPVKDLFKHDIVIVQNKIFDRLTNDLHLPVIARNYLENGESKNLWYEQIVPRLSRFWSMVIYPETLLNDEAASEILFSDYLFKATVQIGANGSIGYGYCSFSKIN